MPSHRCSAVRRPGRYGPASAAAIAAAALIAAGALIAAAAGMTAAGAPAAGAAGSAPASVTYAVPKGERPAALGPYPPRVPFDCADAVAVTLGAGDANTLPGSTAGAPNRNAGYGCVGWNESGGEALYRLTVTQDVVLTATLSGLTSDLDLFLLSACDGDSCLAAANQEFAVRLAPGEYILVVDGFDGASGPYTLTLAARAAGVPAAVCAAGGAERVLCAAAPVVREATLFGQQDLVTAYDCGPYLERGGERWYALVVAGDDTVTAQAKDLAFDAALWLFAGCGPDAECLGFADARSAGGSETLTWRNESLSQRTVYLAVDALRPPADTAAGQFELTITCTGAATLPADARSWGALKRVFK